MLDCADKCCGPSLNDIVPGSWSCEELSKGFVPFSTRMDHTVCGHRRYVHTGPDTKRNQLFSARDLRNSATVDKPNRWWNAQSLFMSHFGQPHSLPCHSATSPWSIFPVIVARLAISVTQEANKTCLLRNHRFVWFHPCESVTNFGGWLTYELCLPTEWLIQWIDDPWMNISWNFCKISILR